MMNTAKNWNLFTWWTVVFIALMPFYVLIKVFFEYKLWVPFFGFFIKELLIVALVILAALEFIRKKIKPKLDILDILVLSYFAYWIAITLVNGLWISHIVHGWRYDFFFLGILLIYKHSAEFLQVSAEKLIKYFLISASASIFLWFLVTSIFIDCWFIGGSLWSKKLGFQAFWRLN